MKNKNEGKDTFTMDEVKELCALIIRRCKASKLGDKNMQKNLRDEMHKLGFYGEDFFGVRDMDLCRFHKLIESGRLKIIDD